MKFFFVKKEMKKVRKYWKKNKNKPFLLNDQNFKNSTF